MVNVALIVLDTLRKDFFDKHFDWLPGTRFENAWSTGCWTVPAHASLFTGKYPSELGVHSKSTTFDCREQALAETLRDHGYNTSAFSCNPYISDRFSFTRGFEQFEGSWRLKSFDPEIFDWNQFISETRDEGATRFPRAVWQSIKSDCRTLKSLQYGWTLKSRDLGWKRLGGINDDGAESALKAVQKKDFGEDEFFFVNLMEAHAPYDPPEEYRKEAPPESPGLMGTVSGTDVEPEPVIQAYEDSIRYLSDIYEEVFEELTEDFDYIITLGDHGELFGEHGAWRHAHGIYPELVRIPLVIYDGNNERGEVKDSVNLLDVYQTVLEATGVGGDSRGRSLLGEIENRKSLVEYHGLNHRHIHSLREAEVDSKTIDVYDSLLRGVVIPDEYYGYESIDGFQHWGSPPQDDPRDELNALEEDLDVRSVDSDGKDQVSESVLKQLDDLGYA